VPRIGGPRKALGPAAGTPAVIWYNSRALSKVGSVAADNLVEIDNVEFRYDVRPVLKGINMRFPRGKVVSIMGLSGCGKTTTLRLIGGQLKPSRGQVRVAGDLVHELDQDRLYALRRRMGMLFQFGALFTDLSVFDNVAFQLREHTTLPEPMIRDLVLMKLNAVGLRGAQRMMPAELSGGMARRVALARAIALDPMLIMYDEPFAGLDPISLGIIGNLIRRLNDASGATSIVVTHDVQESLKIVDYVYFMSEGVVVAEGTPGEIRGSQEAYVHQFVHGHMDGPVPFRYPSAPYVRDLGLEASSE
jgi:phospholipid/cholesterol/gamma-HCH transport system ATP-binding protein